jgi:hypothetical protein
MDRLTRASIIAALADELHSKGSWCGETHLQKAIYLLQEAMDVQLGFDYILYKRGPFSFDLRDELTAMRADGLLRLRPHQQPYGPSLDATDLSKALRRRLEPSLRAASRSISFIAQGLGARGASDLERISTAYYVMHRDLPGASADDQAHRITELKPHVALDQARAALTWVEDTEQAARSEGLTFTV